jgi:hypothetical protein
MAVEVGLKKISTIKTEGILRNSLFLFPKLGIIIKFIRGPLSGVINKIDKLLIPIFGESDIFLIAEK